MVLSIDSDGDPFRRRPSPRCDLLCDYGKSDCHAHDILTRGSAQAKSWREERLSSRSSGGGGATLKAGSEAVMSFKERCDYRK
jgi:hypothetical protein